MKKRKRVYLSWGRTRLASCPRCASTLRSATGLTEDAPRAPGPGDVTLCDQCHTWLTFEPRMTLRLATAAEIATIPRELRALADQVAVFVTQTDKGH